MSKRFGSILELSFCWLFLIANIIYDWVDNPNPDLVYPEDKGLADSRIYFIPLFALVSSLIFGAYNSYKEFGKWHKVQWFLFFLLSVNQVIKNVFFDATVRTYNDYALLLAILIYLCYQFLLKRNK